MARNPSAHPNKAKVADEQARCFDLKLAGKSVRAIAAEMRMAPSTVQGRLQAAYDELVLPRAEESRKLDLERLESWLARLEDRLDQGEDPVRVVPVGLKVLERRAKLLGTDAPERAEMTVHQITAEDVALNELISEARAKVALEEEIVRDGGM